MNELEQAIIGDSAAAPPAHILEGVESDLAHRALGRCSPHHLSGTLAHHILAAGHPGLGEWYRDPLSDSPVRRVPKGERCRASSRGISYANAFSAVISRPPRWRLTRRDSSNLSVAPLDPAIPSASCRSASNWRAWRLTMPIILGASSCCASSFEHGHRPPEALPGDAGHRSAGDPNHSQLQLRTHENLTFPESGSMLREPP